MPVETAFERVRRILREQGRPVPDHTPAARRKQRGDGFARIDAILRGEDPDAPGVDG